jgi:hypothetical protein
MKSIFVRALVFIGMSAPILLAHAHTPYLAPNVFEPGRGGLITLDASFAERFFIPEVAFDDSEFEVHLPSGEVTAPDTVISLKSRKVAEHTLEHEGTYRFSTGRRLGRVFRIYEKDGKRVVPEGEAASVPEGATMVDWYQSYTIAETWVTRGAPSQATLVPRGDGLEYLPVSHPNDLFAVEALELQALYYGEPVADVLVEVFKSSRQSGDDAPLVSLHSDADGNFRFLPREAGVYLLRSRYRSKAPEGSAAPEFSHTYTLVVEAFQ